ncbi:hypothetical protein ABVK25_004408 [Lepraria finkii]|uniref:Uncharacterized protein n=1 Tax=Lepraria finkii TaxID=1340010 RepID=A0ABR4BB84_9LECA
MSSQSLSEDDITNMKAVKALRSAPKAPSVPSSTPNKVKIITTTMMVPEYEFPTQENPWNIYLPLHFSHTEVHRINNKNDPIRKKFRDIDSALWHYFDRINPSTGSSIICGRVGDFDDPDHAYVYDDIKYFETRGIRLGRRSMKSKCRRFLR